MCPGPILGNARGPHSGFHPRKGWRLSSPWSIQGRLQVPLLEIHPRESRGSPFWGSSQGKSWVPFPWSFPCSIPGKVKVPLFGVHHRESNGSPSPWSIREVHGSLSIGSIRKDVDLPPQRAPVWHERSTPWQFLKFTLRAIHPQQPPLYWPSCHRRHS